MLHSVRRSSVVSTLSMGATNSFFMRPFRKTGCYLANAAIELLPRDGARQRQLRQGRLVPKNGGHEPLLHRVSNESLLPTMMPVAGFERKSGNEATLWESSTVALLLRDYPAMVSSILRSQSRKSVRIRPPRLQASVAFVPRALTRTQGQPRSRAA